MPNEALDQVVLNEARRVTAKNRNRWIVPLSSAALILLGIGLSLPLIDLQNDIYHEKRRQPSPAQQVDSLSESDHELAKPTLPQAPASRTTKFRSMADPMPQPQAEMAAPPAVEYRAREKTHSTAAENRLQEQPHDSAQAVLTPQQWLVEIEQLIASGREQAARRALNEFMQRYPDHPIPESLQRLESAE
jgi:hypothetical protein